MLLLLACAPLALKATFEPPTIIHRSYDGQHAWFSELVAIGAKRTLMVGLSLGGDGTPCPPPALAGEASSGCTNSNSTGGGVARSSTASPPLLLLPLLLLLLLTHPVCVTVTLFSGLVDPSVTPTTRKACSKEMMAKFAAREAALIKKWGGMYYVPTA